MKGYAPPQMMRVRAPGKKRRKPRPNLVIGVVLFHADGRPLFERKLRVYVRGATAFSCYAVVTAARSR